VAGGLEDRGPAADRIQYNINTNSTVYEYKYNNV